MPDFTRAPMLYGNKGVLSTLSVDHSEAGWSQLANAQAMSTSTAWGTASLGIYVPVLLDVPCKVYKMSVQNGGTLGGNTDVGIYDEDGVKEVSIGPTAQSGASALQTFDIADTFLMPGVYYLALANTTTTGTYLCGTTTVPRGRSAGCREQTGLTSGTLPTTATFATWTRTFIPCISAHYQTVV